MAIKKNFHIFSSTHLLLQAGLLLGVLLACFLFGNRAVKKEITIPNGASLTTIGKILREEGVVRSSLAFKVAAYAMGRDQTLKTGDYYFLGRVSVFRVIDDLYKGRTIQEVLVVLEGWTVKKILETLESAPYLKGKVSTIPPEGSLMPDSYFYRRGTERQKLIDDMAAAMTQAVDKAWLGRDTALDDFVKDKKEFVILASMVERETSIREEKKRVAGVFINRLRRGMKFESDPTVIYGLSQGYGELKRNLYIKDLKKDHPWNTYTRRGFPITPIANPSRQTLMAVANFEKNNYLYFVATGDGGHNFATNFADHQKNVDAYRLWQNR